MQGNRMIVCDCGTVRGHANLRQELAECGASVEHAFGLISGVAAAMTPDSLRRFLAKHPGARVLPDRRRQIPRMPFGPDEWAEVSAQSQPGRAISSTPQQPEITLALAIMKAQEVHSLGYTGQGVRICVIDSGVDFNHPELQGVAVLGQDGMPLAADFTETDLVDNIGHGTAVAGCIAAQGRQVYTLRDDGTGSPIGYTRIKGVAPGVRIMSAKVFDRRVATGYDSTIIAALEWAAENGAHIVNMSLGGVSLPNDGSDPLSRAVTALRDRGILVVVSAGNAGAGQGSLKSPGSATGALTVGASTMLRSFAALGYLTEGDRWTMDQLASFSSLGPAADGRVKPDLVAPGAYEWGLAPAAGAEDGENVQLFGGTSQAAPFMAGAAALVFQAYHKMRGRYPTPDELMLVMNSTADDLGLPAHMQGAGRVNCLRAVQAVLGQAPWVTVSPPAPLVVQAGTEMGVTLDITNAGTSSAQVPLRATFFRSAPELSAMFHGEIRTADAEQEIPFEVVQGTDLMQISLDWQTRDHSPRSPRLMLAVFDPKGRLVNYQTPNTSGDVELGKSVDAWVARPMQGRWTARVVLRLGIRGTVQPYTLSVRAQRRAPWPWVRELPAQHSLAPGETVPVKLRVAVPSDVTAGTYTGHVLVGQVAVPVSVVVPIALTRGRGAFAGTFQHGYQGSWGNGDWLYHDVHVPPGVRSIITSIQWPDVDNALEFYLINPQGQAVMGRSNNADILDDGNSGVLGGQIVLAHPDPGTWRLALHSFAFCGRSMPEPYMGTVEVGADLVSPHMIHMQVHPGEEAPLALFVRNPGRMPITVQAVAQSVQAKLIWRPLTGQLKSGVTKNGEAHGQGHVTLATVDVPPGTKQVGVVLSWDEPDAEVSLSLFDPVAQNDRITTAGAQGQVLALETEPIPGPWTVMAGVTMPDVAERTVSLQGAAFLVAPQVMKEASTRPVTIQPGAHAVVPVTVRLPDHAETLEGRIMVTTAQGDLLGEVPFRIQSDSLPTVHSEIAVTKE